MAINYSTTVKNARLQAVVTALGATGKLVIGTDALAGASGILVSVPFSNPAFNVSAGAMTVNALPRTTVASATGIAAKVELRDGAGTTVVSGLTIGTPDTVPLPDVIINALEISSGQDVQITVATITQG